MPIDRIKRVTSQTSSGFRGTPELPNAVPLCWDDTLGELIVRNPATDAVRVLPSTPATLAAGTRLGQTAQVSLTNAQILALRATPIEIVAAPGAGLALAFKSILIVFDHTGAYTESTDNLAVKYTNGSGVVASQTIEMTGFADASADAVIAAHAGASPLVTANAALVLHNTGDGEFGGGNAANVWTVTTVYDVLPTGL